MTQTSLKGNPRRRSSQSLKPGFAGRLVRARLEQKKTQSVMAEILGIPYRGYQRIETGERTPEPADLKLISEYFGWSLHELLVECGYLDEAPEIPDLPTESASLPPGSAPLEQTFSTILGPLKVEIIVRVSRA